MKVLLIEAKKDLLKMKIKKGDIIYFRFQIKRNKNNNKLCLIPLSVFNSTSNCYLDFHHKFNIFFNGKIYSVEKNSENINKKIYDKKNQISNFEEKKKQIFFSSPKIFEKKNNFGNFEKNFDKEKKNEIQIYKKKKIIRNIENEDFKVKGLNDDFNNFHISKIILDEDKNDVFDLFNKCTITQSKKRRISKKNKKYN